MSELTGASADGSGAAPATPSMPLPNKSHHHHHTHDGECGGHAHSKQPMPFDPSALVSARGLGVSRSGRTILSNVDIDVHAGEILTLIGPNGSGKTTLVRTLLGLEAPDTGELRRARGLVVGYVPQRFDIDHAIPMTVTRFLSLGSGDRRDQIERVLAEVGASSTSNQQLGALSGGELQRVLLARALLNKPRLLVLDEPVRGVDYVGEAELYTLIEKLRDTRSLGVLLVSHDLHVVMAQANRVVCLNRHVCCSGVPETVAQHPEYVRLFGAEAARTFAVYHHHHDHRHDLTGETAPQNHESDEGPSA